MYGIKGKRMKKDCAKCAVRGKIKTGCISIVRRIGRRNSMQVLHSEWRGRIDHWIRTLKNDFYRPLSEISLSACCTMEELTPEDAERLDYVPVAPGFSWGHTYEYCWMKGTVTLPAEADGKWIVLNLKPQGEATLFVNGKAFGTYRADWISDPHHYIEDNILTTAGKPGDRYELMMEVYAGHYFPEAPSGGCATGPVLPGSYQDPLKEGERRTLGSCTYGIWNEDAYQLYIDVMTLKNLLEVTDEKSLRASKLAKALMDFTLIVDFEQEEGARTESYRKARAAIQPALYAHNGSTAARFYAIGNAHLDLAWLWPMQETYRKTARTFAAQLRLIDLYPTYKFLQSQPASYEMCRKYYPELFERIKAAVKKGQWIAEGAMWVEPDTNMSGGEALIRQVLYGKKYYKEVFDVDSEILWLPDTFGYTGALPQILKGTGVKYLVTQKIFWSYNEGEDFPYHYFSWRGIDGSEVISFLPTSYTYRTDPHALHEIWESRRQLMDLDAFLVPFGYGDGGGGPCRDYIEYLERQEDLEGSPRTKMSGPNEFFHDMEAAGKPVNTWSGELYFTAHRGTYTSQAVIKKNNRKAELTLRELELWGALASKCGQYEFPAVKNEKLWKEVLLHQFHDILPGSGIAYIYKEAEARVGAVIREGKALSEKAREALAACLGTCGAESAGGASAEASAVSVFNSLSFPRTEVVEIPEVFKNGAVTADGIPVPVDYDEKTRIVKALVSLPAMGAAALLPARQDRDTAVQMKADMPAGSESSGAGSHQARILETDAGFVLENDLVRAEINRRGEVTSFILKASGREFAAAPMNRFRVFKDVPRMFDAWDIDSNYVLSEIQDEVCLTAEAVGDGLVAELKVEGRILGSAISQTIRLASDARRLEFDTVVDWKELHRLLKVSFPVDVYATEGINEMQFGYVTRPTHRSRQYDKDRFEVCNHRYSALCDGAHGAAVLNDCKYGISMNENALELTLLRASASPEMQADNRVHHFTYAFTAWEGSFADSNVLRDALALNVPASVVPGSAADFSAFSVDKNSVIIDTVKPAEDKSTDLILRVYEAMNAPGTAKIHVDLPVKKAYICDMLENIQEELEVTDGVLALPFRSFEIKTIRLS